VVHEFGSAPDPGVTSTHRQIQAGLVEEYQTMRRNAANAPQIRCALYDDIRPQTLQRSSALFFTT
jgi:hypothetical protein